MSLPKTLVVLTTIALMLGSTTTASAGHEISIGTLAPAQSEWGKVFRVWAKAVKKKSKGKLKIKWYFNASQGDPKAMIAKIVSKQLDGAAVPAGGLAKVHKDFLAVQMPGLCQSWKCMDKVRASVAKELQKKAEKKGFIVSGWGDVGLAYTFSKGITIKSPKDLRKSNGAKVAGVADNPIQAVLSSELKYTPVVKTIATFLPALSNGEINVITVPALVAEQLQWTPHLSHVGEDVVGTAIGAMVFGKGRLDGLPGDLKKLLVKTGKKARKMLTKRIRKHDKKAYKRARKKMKIVKLTKPQKYRWKNVFKKIRRKLAQQVFPADLVKKLEAAAGK